MHELLGVHATAVTRLAWPVQMKRVFLRGCGMVEPFERGAINVGLAAGVRGLASGAPVETAWYAGWSVDIVGGSGFVCATIKSVVMCCSSRCTSVMLAGLLLLSTCLLYTS